MYSETEPYENLIEVLIDFTDRRVDLRFRLLGKRKDRKEARALRNSMVCYLRRDQTAATPFVFESFLSF
jgi:hypothetical protein